MSRTLSAVALALALGAATPGWSLDAQTMDAVTTGMAELGFEVDPAPDLTETQALEILAVLEGAASDEDKVAQIETILGM